VVLEDGRVVESGRHAELLAASGPYARLVAAQQITDPEVPVFVGG
jgi:ABC-type multidrug transport system fused ATPase/permease subunit